MTKLMLALMLIASAADIASTEYGLSVGAMEGNSVMQSRAVRIASNVAFPIIAYALTRNKPGMAKWICIGYVGGKSAIAGRNFYVGIQLRWGR